MAESIVDEVVNKLLNEVAEKNPKRRLGLIVKTFLNGQCKGH
jgi:hypothetical protein